ncbi:MAG: transglutaminase family protein [Candidatus Bipolaricaulaceae bacterium]
MDYVTLRTLTWEIPRYLFCLSQAAPLPRRGEPWRIVELINWREDDVFLWRLAKAINQDLTDYYVIATNTLYFVQRSIRYIQEKDDYWQTPVETLYLGHGDCEDTTILYVALLAALGFPVAFGHYPGHMFALVPVHPSWVERRTTVFNKCLLQNKWAIFRRTFDQSLWAIAETACDPIYWLIGAAGLGCGFVPKNTIVWMIDLAGNIFRLKLLTN